VVGQGIRSVERLLALLETAGDQRLPALAAEMLGILATQLRYVAEQVKEVEVKLLARHLANETSRRLQSVPSLGPITASAIVATVGDPKQFKSGRQFAAWLGLVPQQRSSGGKERLGGISKRGDGYIRQLLFNYNIIIHYELLAWVIAANVRFYILHIGNILMATRSSPHRLA